MVESEHGRSREARHVADKKLREEGAPIYYELEDAAFKVISDWYHFAILELAKLKSFKINPEWIARKLAITPEEAKNAVARLVQMEMLVKKPDSSWAHNDRYFANIKQLPNKTVREYHRQILKKTMEAMETHPVGKREHFSMSVAISDEDLPRIQDKIRAFRDELALDLAKNSKKESVYQISLHFFPLTTEDNSHEKMDS